MRYVSVNETNRGNDIMARTTKSHAVDAYDAEQIANAVRFTAHFMIGRGEKATVECATLDEARAAAAELNAEYGVFGRRAMVYAISANGATFHVA
jgi:hypothetical protein